MTKNICRICQDDSHSENNMLISPCACKGSMSYVHANCLNKWRFINKDNEKFNGCHICGITYIKKYKYMNEDVFLKSPFEKFNLEPFLFIFLNLYAILVSMIVSYICRIISKNQSISIIKFSTNIFENYLLIAYLVYNAIIYIYLIYFLLKYTYHFYKVNNKRVYIKNMFIFFVKNAFFIFIDYISVYYFSYLFLNLAKYFLIFIVGILNLKNLNLIFEFHKKNLLKINRDNYEIVLNYD